MIRKKVIARKKEVESSDLNASSIALYLCIALNTQGFKFNFQNYSSEGGCVFTINTQAKYTIKIHNDRSVSFEWCSDPMINQALYMEMQNRSDPQKFNLSSNYTILLQGTVPYFVKLTTSIRPKNDILKVLDVAEAFSSAAAKFSQAVDALWHECTQPADWDKKEVNTVF